MFFLSIHVVIMGPRGRVELVGENATNSGLGRICETKGQGKLMVGGAAGVV